MGISKWADGVWGRAPGSLLEVREKASGDARTLWLSGELDTAGARELTILVELGTEDVAVVVLDLTGLTFINSIGMRALLSARRICEAQGREVVVVVGDGIVRRTIVAPDAFQR